MESLKIDADVVSKIVFDQLVISVNNGSLGATFKEMLGSTMDEQGLRGVIDQQVDMYLTCDEANSFVTTAIAFAIFQIVAEEAKNITDAMDGLIKPGANDVIQ